MTPNPTPAAGNDRTTLVDLRPTLYIGLGGFGCTVVRNLKRSVRELAPERIDGFGFLCLDTQKLPDNDILSTYEYVPLSVNVSPKEVVKNFPDQLGWFSEVFGKFVPGNIMGGASAIRALGRFAFRNPPVFTQFVSRLDRIMVQLQQLRPGFAAGRPVKVYVISSIAGGSGSGCLLDVLAATGAVFSKYGIKNFPYQAILATPDVLLGAVSNNVMPELQCNAYATLKELNHFLSVNREQVIENYDGSQYARVEVGSLLPQVFHVIGNRNEQNAVIVREMPQLAHLASQYLLSEIRTPVPHEEGIPRIHDLEADLPFLMTEKGIDDSRRCFSSFGVVQAGVPADVLGRQWSLKIAFATLNREISEASASEEAAQWIAANKLAEKGTDEFQNLLTGPLGDELKVPVDAKGQLLVEGTSRDDLQARASVFSAEKLSETKAAKLPLLDARAQTLRDALLASLHAAVVNKIENATIGRTVGFLESLINQLRAHQAALTGETVVCRAALADLTDKGLPQSLVEVQAAAGSSFFGRKSRIEDALSNFQTRLDSAVKAELDLWVKERCLSTYAALLGEADRILTQWKTRMEILKGIAHLVEQRIAADDHTLDQLSDFTKRGAGNQCSLISSKAAADLYGETISASLDGTVQLVRKEWLAAGRLVSVEPNRDNWIEDTYRAIHAQHVESVLSKFTILDALKRFHGTPESMRVLFGNLVSLSASMFWLNESQREGEYRTHSILAIHPTLQKDFEELFGEFLSGDSKVYAHSSSLHGIQLYQLKLGYTLLSHRSLPTYEAAYKFLSQKYAHGIRPIHAWPGAADWDEPLPQKGEEAAIQSFVLGRAFATLFPLEATGRGKHGTFLHSSGSHYYLSLDEDKKPVDLGNGLEEALGELASHPEWQKQLQEAIEAKISELGRSAIKDRLVQGYVPLLTEEIEKAEGGTDQTRANILRKLQRALKQYIQKELTSSAV